MNHKNKIIKIVKNSTPDFFWQPSIGIQEYPLDITGKKAKADFRFEFAGSGLLFIEDEDDNAQRALNNLAKYWRWCKENPKYQPVHVISICGPENINTDNFKFLKKKIETDLIHFKCHMINHSGSENWHQAGADWHKELENVKKNSIKLKCMIFRNG